MFDTCELVVTTPNPDWLGGMTLTLVRTGLVARAHITEGRSISLSNGELHDTTEWRATLHTRRSNVTTIVDLLERDHQDQASCIVALPITDGHPTYLQWVRTQTKAPSHLPVPR